MLGEVAEHAESPVQAAITASAFTALMATLPSDQSSSWELPVRSCKLTAVPSSELAAGRSGERVVLFDKPLQSRVMNLRQKHEKLYKAAVIALGTNSQRGNTPTLENAAAFSGPANNNEDVHVLAHTVPGSPGAPHNVCNVAGPGTQVPQRAFRFIKM